MVECRVLELKTASEITTLATSKVLLTTIMVFIMAALTAAFFSLVDIVIRFGLTAVLNAF